jgi:hypothetical protein
MRILFLCCKVHAQDGLSLDVANIGMQYFVGFYDVFERGKRGRQFVL